MEETRGGVWEGHVTHIRPTSVLIYEPRDPSGGEGRTEKERKWGVTT